MNVDIHPQRILSLCSGVGMLDEGLRIGLDYIGVRSQVVAYVERDSYAAACLMARMAESSLEPAPISDDLNDIDERWRGKVDWLVSGFPCQPWSHAGKQEGTEDERWLWPLIFRIGLAVRPQFWFLENVPGLVSGGGLEIVLSDLAKGGWDAEWLHLTAESVGASHRRERVFVMAHAGCKHRDLFQWASRLYEHSGSRRKLALSPLGRLGIVRQPSGGNGQPDGGDTGYRSNGSEGRRESAGRGISGKRRSSLADTERPRPQGDRPGITQRRNILGPCGTDGRIFAPGPGADWGSIPEEFWPAIEPGFRGVVNGTAVVVDESRADALRCLGNSVVPLQAAVAFIELIKGSSLCKLI